MEKYCNKTVTQDQVNIFNENARIIICGGSFTGKSKLCSDLILFYKDEFDVIIIANSPNKDEMVEMLNMGDKVVTHDTIPSISQVNDYYVGSKLIVLDDNYLESFNSKEVLSFFTRGRHSNISVILITHNLFLGKAKYSRDISLNMTHVILMKLRDLNQVQILAKQIFGKKDSQKVLDIYKYILETYKYPHMLIDLSINSVKEIEIRSNIISDIPQNKFETTYQVM